jgi:hypothetical protein
MSNEVNSDKYKRPSQHSGSALVLVLLITALLATIAVSFLSTSRVEQIAAKNFSRQNAASGLAELATQKAMAKIQLGFNATGNGTGNFTSVITTQPGAINKYFFSNGTLLTNRTITTDLFSTGSGNLSYLNNLENPSSSQNATTNQYTITGNRGERINVPMENVNATISGNTTVIGRIAYFVDDEGTKLNANNAIGNRTTLNAALRPLDIGSLNATYSSNFTSVVNQTTTTNSSSIKNWNYFFRSEQVGSAINSAGGNFSNNDLPLLTTAVTSANNTANMTHLLTPWGTQRLFINELPITSVGVNRTFSTLTGNATTGSTANDVANGLALNNIFGGNFSQKYNDLGVKQIAANMLQMRSPNTSTVNASFSYNGTLLGAESFIGANYTVDAIPMDYMGYAPYPVISEVSVAAAYYITTGSISPPPNWRLGFIRPSLQVMVELYNPYNITFNSTDARIVIKMNSFTFNCTHRIRSGNQTFGPFTYGPSGNYTDDSSPQAWGSGNDYLNNNTLLPDPNNRAKWNAVLRDNANANTLGKLQESYFSQDNPMSYPNSRGSPIAAPSRIEIPPYSKVQFHLFSPSWGVYGQVDATKSWGANNATITYNNTDVEIIKIDNLSVGVSYVKLIANKSDASSVRDWVRGPEIGFFSPEIRNQDGNGTILRRISTSNSTNWNRSPGQYMPPVSPNTYQRICPLLKTTVNATATLSDDTRAWTNMISTNSTHSLISLGSATTTNYMVGNSSSPESFNYTQSNPSFDQVNSIPSDPSFNNTIANAVFAGSNSSDMREPYLITGNYSCPADLGLVPTNKRWRRLRMQMQPKQEVSISNGGIGNQTYIPDWSMLDAISFGNSTTLQHPVNINGRFNLPTNPVPTPRTIGIQALAKVLESSSNATIQDPINPASSNSTDATRFRGNTVNATTIANAIGNMTWSDNSTWGQGNATSDPGSRRKTKNFPANTYILPSEIMEIAGVADAVSQTDYANSSSHFKWNEGRASALIPAITTRSSFFMIYAHAQAGQLQDKNQPESASNPFVVDSEALTKTLVEVQYNSGNYTVKKLYTQPIPLGQ